MDGEEFLSCVASYVCRHVSDVTGEAILTPQILSLYQGLVTKNLQSFILQYVYFYGYSFFRRLYLKKQQKLAIGARANLLVAIAAAACTEVVTQPLDTASSKMQTSEFGKSKEFWKTLRDRTWREAFDGLGISLLLTINPSSQVSAACFWRSGWTSVLVSESNEEDENDDSDPKNRKTIPGALRSIWRREGLFGFFEGLQVQILKTLLSSALLLMVKEKITKSTWVILLAVGRFLLLNRIKLKDSY